MVRRYNEHGPCEYDGEHIVRSNSGRAQRIFLMQPAVDVIGHKWPKVVRTRWLFLMDSLAHFVDNSAKCTYLLMDHGEALRCRDHLSLEVFDLYIILLLFYCFCISALWNRVLVCG
jgi:hypothetical protein